MVTEVITTPGDRWDLIAYRAYGTIGEVIRADGSAINAISLLMLLNPTVPYVAVLSEGLLLTVEVIPIAGSRTDRDLLPPWK